MVVAAARAGDESTFGTLVERHRWKLQVPCYRLLGSFEDAEDMVRETLLRAWRKRKSFKGRSTFGRGCTELPPMRASISLTATRAIPRCARQL